MRVIKRFGYFWEDDGGKDANGRSLYERVRRNPPDKCEQIVRYLSSAPLIRWMGVRTIDVLSSRRELICEPDNLTDGEWMWTRDLAYYVENYNVELPQEFLATMERRNFVPPVLKTEDLLEIKSALYVDWMDGESIVVPYRDSYGARRHLRMDREAPPQPKPNRMLKDASVFFLTCLGFFVAGILLQIVNGHVKYAGPGFSPLEVMSAFMFTAAAVLGAWASVKLVLAGWEE